MDCTSEILRFAQDDNAFVWRTRKFATGHDAVVQYVSRIFVTSLLHYFFASVFSGSENAYIVSPIGTRRYCRPAN
jgi:hypothetical protein